MKRISTDDLKDARHSKLHGIGLFNRGALRGLHLKKKAGAIIFFIIFVLISQMLSSAVMVGAEDDIPDSDYGVQEGLHRLISEKESNAKTIDESLENGMSSYLFNATNQSIPESEVYADHQLPAVSEELIDPVPENVRIETLEPIRPLYPRIFDLAEHSMVNETDTLLETLLEGQDNYWIHTDYFPPEGGRISKWTNASLLPSFMDPDQGFKLSGWNGVDVDDNLSTGDNDRAQYLLESDGGFDIYVRMSVTVPDLEDIFKDVEDIWDLPDAAARLLEFLNGTDLEFEAGLKIEIVKDSYWAGIDLPVDVGIVKGIGYEDVEFRGIEYIWIGDFNFSDVPQAFEFQILLGVISIFIGENLNLVELLDTLGNLIWDVITGNENATYDFASFAPPYTVNVKMDRDGNDPEAFDNDSITSLNLLFGYDKLIREGNRHRILDRTWVSTLITPDESEDFIPKNFHVKLYGKKSPITERTQYDAFEWYSRIPVNVSVIYSEGKLNDTYVVADIIHMPYGRLSSDIMDEMSYTSLRGTLRNLTEEKGENFTRIIYDSTEEIEKVELWGFEYDHGYAPGHQYNGTHIQIRDIPTDILLEGSFILKEAEDPFTVFDNVSISFINGIVDNAMLALASTIYAVGIELRSIPDSLADVASEGGTILLEMTDKNGDLDHLGMAEVAIAYGYVHPDPSKHGRYAVSNISNHDYLTSYIDKGTSGVPDKVAIGLRVSGIGKAYYEGIQDEEGNLSDIHIELDTDTTFYRDEATGRLIQYAYDNPRFEVFYLTGYGDDFIGEDFASIALSNLPRHIEIDLRENITIYDASGSSGHTTIKYLSYQSLIDGQYMEFNITHIPSYLRFMNNDTILSLSTIHSLEGASESERLKPYHYDRADEFINLELLLTNESRNGKFIKRTMPSNFVIVYKDADLVTLNGSKGAAAVSGRFKGIKSLYYESDKLNERTEVEIRIENPDKENLAVRLLDDSTYHGDITSGLWGSAIIGPIPEYIHLEFKRVEPKTNITEPDTSNLSGFSDIERLMDSVKDFGRSIVDVVHLTIEDTLKGVGMIESTDFWMDFSMHDPILERKTNPDVIANITRGRITEMYARHPEYSRAYWTRGMCMRQDIIDRTREEAIFDIKVYLTGLPSKGSLCWNASGDYLFLSASLQDFAPKSDWMVLDAKGIGDTDLLIHASGLASPMDMDFSYEADINATEGTIDGNLHSHVTSKGEDVDMGEFFAAIWSNASEYTRTRLFIPQVPSSMDLSLYLNDSLGLDYTGSSGMDFILMDMKIGDISQLMDQAYWTHGVVIRNGTDDGGDHIMDMRMYLEGVPEAAKLDIESEDDNTKIDMALANWDPDRDWVLLDLKGLNNTDILLYQDLNGGSALDLDLSLDITAPESGEELLVHADFTVSRDLGGLYLKFRAPGLEDPVILQLYLLEVPHRMEADISIEDGIYANYSASKGIDHLFARIHRRVDGKWYYLTLMLHDIPDYIEASLSPNKEFDPEKSIILQGNPDIEFKCSGDGLDVYLDMDGRVNNAYGHTMLQAGDLTNNTKITLTEPDVYSIDSPGGVEFVYLIISDLPIMENFYLEELYIYAEDVRSVDIHVRQLFGLYPIFKLTNTDGGRIHIKLKQRIGGENGVPLEAGILDVRYRTLPILAPLFVNHVSVSLSTNHIIIPEPITTVLATIWAGLRGLKGVI